MSGVSIFEMAVRKIMNDNLPMFASEGTVKSVDKANNTCTVEREGMATLNNVRLNAILEAGNEVITIYPQVGANIICLIIEDNATDALMIATNKIDEIIINGGTNGGLAITPELVTQLNKTNEVVNVIVDAIKNWTVAPSDGGAALKTYFAAAIGTKSVGNFENVENEKIKH
jgi:hypothetical protein